MHRCSTWILAIALGALSASSLPAGVVVSTSVESGAGPFTPSYTTPAGDLLSGLSPTAQAGNFTLEGTGGVSVLTNGTFGSITGIGGNNPALATVGNGNGSGSTVTYSLNLGGAPLGYDISSIITQGGWNDSGRDQQLYNVYYSTVANPGVFVQLGDMVDFQPPGVGAPTATQVSVTSNTSYLASGVGALRFDFGPPNGPNATENGHVGMAELIALGAPTAASTNLLVNGNFESPVVAGNGNHIGAAPTGWSVNTNDVNGFNLVRDPAGTFDGNQYLDLTNQATSISQQFTLATLSTIEFGANFSPRDGVSGGGRVSIYDATNTVAIYDSPIVLAGPAYQWLLSSATTGPLAAGTYTLRISLDDPANVDGAFANPTAVPEPSTLALGLLGLTGVFAAIRRR